jgi:glutathione S-transferase
MLDFFWNPYSPYALKVHFFLEEAGRPYKLHFVDLGKGDHRQPEFLRRNPCGAVPAIELDGFGLGESNAIVRYLADKWQLTSFYPTNLEDRARVDMLAEFASLHVGRWLQAYAWNAVAAPKFGMPSYPDAITEARAALAKNLPRLEGMLAGRNFLSGPTVTLADVALFPVATSARTVLPAETFAEAPLLSAWIQRLAERPSWKKVLAARDKQLRELGHA